MRFIQRCLLLAFAIGFFLAFWYFGRHRRKSDIEVKWRQNLLNQVFINHMSSPMAIPPAEFLMENSKCRMETCFNFSKCRPGKPFKVYTYHDTSDELSPKLDNFSYGKILDRIRNSHYHTNNPEDACLFVPPVDTMDRDELQTEGFVKNLQSRLSRLPHWNEGQNHLIFNLYSGTYKNDYLETDLSFNSNRAILAKASLSDEHYRPGFDVSLPLFGPNHQARGSDAIVSLSNPFPVSKKHTLVFKGKRYLHGIGSETRNSVYHLHNGQDMVLVTTCKHGKDWEKFKDARCDEDNMEYDR